MNILYIGDIMASYGVQKVAEILPGLVANEQIDIVVAQSENVTDGKGLSVADMRALQNTGIHIFTGGNHTPAVEEIHTLLADDTEPVVGPANMLECPGKGYKVIAVGDYRMLVVSLLGSIVGRQADTIVDNPLQKIDSILAEVPRDSYDASVVNFHGDFSSEKVVIGHYLDGRVSMVVGDHWHVATADARVLPKGSAHMSDVGMCGALDSSLGVTYESIIPRWRDGLQTRNILAHGGSWQFNALLATIDDETGRATSARHIRLTGDS
ncbi:MAG: TIGR00282 family metallophosphoesterase [Candidatus Saccharimonadales bacterium]